MIDYKTLANYIIMKCNKDNKEISNLKLQKMVFYCQAYHIAKYREQLIDNKFEAWKHGAVLPALYNDYSYLGYNNKQKYEKKEYDNIRSDLGEYLTGFLDKIINEFSDMTASEIRELNHSEEPWKEARRGYEPDDSCNEIIKEDTIYKYYSQLLYKGGINNMEDKKSRRISIKDKNLLLAKKRLSQRELYKIDEENKNEYYEVIFNDFTEGREYTWRAMNGN